MRIALGPALIAVKGAPTPEVEKVYQRAFELVEELGAGVHRFPAQWGLWYVNYTRGEYPVAREAGERLLATARKGDDSGQLLEAHHSLWPTLVAMGRPLEAISHMEHGMALYDPERHGMHAFLYAGHDPGACCRFHLGMTRWLLGYADSGLSDVRDADRLAAELNHPLTMVIAGWFTAWVHCQRGEHELAIASFERLTALARPYALAAWADNADAILRMMRRECTSVAAIEELHQQLRASPVTTTWRKMVCTCMLAELCAYSGHADEALQILRSIPDEHRRAFAASEILRLEGEFMLKQRQPALGAAQHLFNEAIDLARSRGEKSLELRAAMSLARMLDGQHRREEAHSVLAGVYGWFTEGFDTADLKSAKTLLATLS